MRLHTLFYFLTWHNDSINDNKDNDLHTSSPYLTCSAYVLMMMSKSIADDIIMTRQLWHDHVKSDIKLVRYQFHSRRYQQIVAFAVISQHWGATVSLNHSSWKIKTCLSYTYFIGLTLKHRETHGCVVSTVATDALVLKHQAISIHNAD